MSKKTKIQTFEDKSEEWVRARKRSIYGQVRKAERVLMRTKKRNLGHQHRFKELFDKQMTILNNHQRLEDLYYADPETKSAYQEWGAFQ